MDCRHSMDHSTMTEPHLDGVQRVSRQQQAGSTEPPSYEVLEGRNALLFAHILRSSHGLDSPHTPPQSSLCVWDWWHPAVCPSVCLCHQVQYWTLSLKNWIELSVSLFVKHLGYFMGKPPNKLCWVTVGLVEDVSPAAQWIILHLLPSLVI